MAISRGAGTEIIRSVYLEECDSTDRIIIFGEQHHIYTVLSIFIFAYSIQAAGNYVNCNLYGYDSFGGSPNVNIELFRQEMQAAETFVWNDKFSFNGVQPVDFAGPLSTAAHQNALADQAEGSATTQQLYLGSENASDNFHCQCTFIDQNNA